MTMWMFDGLGSTLIGVAVASALLPWLLHRATVQRATRAIAAELRFNAHQLEEWLQAPIVTQNGDKVLMNKKFLLASWRTFGSVVPEVLDESDFLGLARLYGALETTEKGPMAWDVNDPKHIRDECRQFADRLSR